MGYPQIGISFASVQHLKGLGLEFKDNFSDNSIHWAWNVIKHEENHRIVEENGVLKIETLSPTPNARWLCNGEAYNEAPKVFMNVMGYPAEIVAKIEALTLGDDTQAGLFFSLYPDSQSPPYYNAIVRRKEVGAEPFNGVGITDAFGNRCAWMSQDDIQNLPVWLRIRIGCYAQDAPWLSMAFSLDGATWIELWNDLGIFEYIAGNQGAGLTVGLFISNDVFNIANFHPIVSWFGSFKMKIVTKD